MLRALTLTNFRRHRAATFNFGPGINAIRGVNEAGKTTLAEAMAYALFGAKALRDPFADVVTWDEKEASMRVVAEMEMGGTRYTFSRGKSGAECRYGDKLVTGQDEVSSFAGKLLGCDWKIAPKLMIASQKGLAGALEEGPAKTGEMIERLADFDLFDRLVDAMTEQLALGPAGPYEQRVKEAQDRLDALPLLPEVDSDAVRAKAVELQGKAAQGREWIESIGAPAASAAKTALDLAGANAAARRAAEAGLDAARAALAKHEGELAKAQINFVVGPSAEAVAAARVAVADAEKLGERVAAHAAVTKLMAAYPDEFWDEPMVALNHALVAAQTAQAAALERARAAETDILVARSKRTTSSVCGFCDQDVSQFPEVAAHNASLDAVIAADTTLMESSKAEAEAGRQDVIALQAVLNSAKPYQQAALRYAAFVDVDESVVPPRLTWKGEVPNAGEDKGTAARRLSALEESQRAAERAKTTIEFLDRAIADDLAAVAERERAVAELPAAEDFEGLKAEADHTATEVRAAETWAREYEAQASALAIEEAQARAAVEARLLQRETLASQLSEQRKQLDELAFNNGLREKVRRARPIIADKLWNTVLASVSTMFTQMRGMPSLVTKDKDGFKVNGKGSALSGSTLDLLGLAIRVALVKTFLPFCPFLLVDEPFAACDDGRTSNMLGFIIAAGFEQVIVITHEDMSEAVADNLVTL